MLIFVNIYTSVINSLVPLNFSPGAQKQWRICLLLPNYISLSFSRIGCPIFKLIYNMFTVCLGFTVLD
jgi:hypothetical protein